MMNITYIEHEIVQSPTKAVLSRKREMIEISKVRSSKKQKVDFVEEIKPTSLENYQMHQRFSECNRKIKMTSLDFWNLKEHIDILYEISHKIDSMNVHEHLTALDSHLREVIENLLVVHEDYEMKEFLTTFKAHENAMNEFMESELKTIEDLRMKVAHQIWKVEELTCSFDLSERVNIKIRKMIDELQERLVTFYDERKSDRKGAEVNVAEKEAILELISNLEQEIQHSATTASEHQSEVLYLKSKIYIYESLLESAHQQQQLQQHQEQQQPQQHNAISNHFRKPTVTRKPSASPTKTSNYSWIDFDKENCVNQKPFSDRFSIINRSAFGFDSPVASNSPLGSPTKRRVFL